MSEQKKLLTPLEVAERLGITPATVRRWANEGRLPAVRLGRLIRFHPDDIDALLSELRTPTVAMPDRLAHHVRKSS